MLVSNAFIQLIFIVPETWYSATYTVLHIDSATQFMLCKILLVANNRETLCGIIKTPECSDDFYLLRICLNLSSMATRRQIMTLAITLATIEKPQFIVLCRVLFECRVLIYR